MAEDPEEATEIARLRDELKAARDIAAAAVIERIKEAEKVTDLTARLKAAEAIADQHFLEAKAATERLERLLNDEGT